MSDGKDNHAGLMRTAEQALKDMLTNDAVLIENQVKVIYALDHPAKQIVGGVPKYVLKITPAGFSQTTSAGKLDLQYFTWITLRFKPSTMGQDAEDELSYLCEYLADMLHKKMIGGMSTYVSRCLINFQTFKLQFSHREIQLVLAKDEIGAIMCLWQSPKTIEEIGDDEEAGGDE